MEGVMRIVQCVLCVALINWASFKGENVSFLLNILMVEAKMVKLCIEGSQPKLKKINLLSKLSEIRQNLGPLVDETFNFYQGAFIIELEDESKFTGSEIISNNSLMLSKKVVTQGEEEQKIKIILNNGESSLELIEVKGENLASIRNRLTECIQAEFSFVFENTEILKEDENEFLVEDIKANDQIFVKTEIKEEIKLEKEEEKSSLAEGEQITTDSDPQSISDQNRLVQEIYKRFVNKQQSIMNEKTIRGTSAENLLLKIESSAQIIEQWQHFNIMEMFQEGLFLNIYTYQGLKGIVNKLNSNFNEMKYEDKLSDDEFLRNAPFSEQLFFIACLIASSDQMKAELNKIYSVYDPLPLIFPALSENTFAPIKYEFNQQLIWSIEPSYLCISFPFGEVACQQIGKTSTLADLFQIPLKRSSDIITRHCVQLYTYKSLQPIDSTPMKILNNYMSWSFIDVPGLLPVDEFQKLLSLSSVFIIHSDYKELYLKIDEFMVFLNTKLPQNITSLFLFIHSPPLGVFSQAKIIENTVFSQLYNQLKARTQTVVLVPITKSGQTFEIELIKKQFFNNFWSYPTQRGFKFDFDQNKLLQLCHSPIREGFQLLENCIKVFKGRNNSSESMKLLSFYPIFIKRVRLEEIQNVLIQQSYFNKNVEKDIEILKQEIAACYEQLNKQKISPLHQVFLKLFEHPCRNLLLGELQLRLKQLSIKEEEKVYSNEHISIEILFRETWLAYLAQPIPLSELINLQKVFIEYVQSGEPFELIDGDNNYCFVRIFKSFLSGLSKEKVCFIAVLGPQSSGKSTLLKYAFGCHFQTSSGRCTKGVYASYQKLDPTLKFVKYKHALIIDTEGIESIEREKMFSVSYNQEFLDKHKINVKLEDQHFKRTINFDILMTLFCFQVSEAIILNVKGENFDSYMKDLLTICIRGLIMLKLENVKSPEIILAMNQVGNSSLEMIQSSLKLMMDQISNKDEIQKLMGSFVDKNEMNIEKLIAFNSKNIVALPNAFKTEHLFNNSNFPGLNKMEFSLMKSEERFGYQTLKFRDIILSILKERQNQFSLFNMEEWFDLCQSVWDSVYNEKELLKVKNLEELQESQRIQEFEQEFLKTNGAFDKAQKQAFEQLQQNKQTYKQQIATTQNVNFFESHLKEKILMTYDSLRRNFHDALEKLIEQHSLKKEYLIDETKRKIYKQIQQDQVFKMQQFQNFLSIEQSNDLLAKTKLCIQDEMNEIVKNEDIKLINIEEKFEAVYCKNYEHLINQIQEQQLDPISYVDRVYSIANIFIGSYLNHNLRYQCTKELSKKQELTDISDKFRKQIFVSFENDLKRFLKVETGWSYNLEQKLMHQPLRNGNYCYFDLKQFITKKEGSVFQKISNYFSGTYKLHKKNLKKDYEQLFYYLYSDPIQRKQMDSTMKHSIQTYVRWFVQHQINWRDLIERILEKICSKSQLDYTAISNKIYQIQEEKRIFANELLQLDIYITPEFDRTIYDFAIVYWASLAQKYDLAEKNRILEELDHQKQELMLTFKDKIENIINFEKYSESGELDKKVGRKFCRRLKECIDAHYKEKALESFDQQFQIDTISNRYTPAKIKHFISTLINSDDNQVSDDKLYEFIRRPRIVIVKDISREIKQLSDPLYASINAQYEQNKEKALKGIIQMFEAICKEVENKEGQKLLTCNQIVENQDFDIQTTLKLFTSILKEHILDTLGNVQLQNKLLNVDLQKLFAHGYPQKTDALTFELDLKVKLCDVLEEPDIQIYSLWSFLQEVIQESEKEIQISLTLKPNSYYDSDDSDSYQGYYYYQSLQMQIQATIERQQEYVLEESELCGISCPSCGRGCDKDKNHGDESKHECSSGHYFMAFQGWRSKETKNATLLSCDTMFFYDLKVLNSKNESIPFRTYVSNYPEWAFASDKLDAQVNIENMNKIWLKNDGAIGKRICKKYGTIYHTKFINLEELEERKKRKQRKRR